MLHQYRCRSGRHVISLPIHRRSNGHCAACARENESRYQLGLLRRLYLPGRTSVFFCH